MIIKGKFSLFLHKKICCGYSLESPRRGDSNEYQQHMFLLRSDENYPLIIIKYPSYLLCCNLPPSLLAGLGMSAVILKVLPLIIIMLILHNFIGWKKSFTPINFIRRNLGTIFLPLAPYMCNTSLLTKIRFWLQNWNNCLFLGFYKYVNSGKSLTNLTHLLSLWVIHPCLHINQIHKYKII